jgi:hypothetical protein
MNGKDREIKITQDPKIIQQILKSVPDNGKNQINVIMIGQVNQEHEDFDLMSYLQSLPEPRVKNLKLKAIIAAKRFFRNDKQVANFLGISHRQLLPSYKDYYKKELQEEDETQLPAED